MAWPKSARTSAAALKSSQTLLEILVLIKNKNGRKTSTPINPVSTGGYTMKNIARKDNTGSLVVRQMKSIVIQKVFGQN